MKVIFLRSNSLAVDSRVKKETTSLAKNHYQVTALAWDRENIFPPLEIKDSGVIVKRFKLPACMHKKLGEEMGASARELAKDFDWEVITRKLYEQYLKI